MSLSRLVRVVDIETTGMTPPPLGTAEVIEVGWQDVRVFLGMEGLDTRLVGQPTGMLHMPERPCPPEVLAVHHILPEELEGHPPHLPDTWLQQTGDRPHALAAHNAEFEMSFLGSLDTPWICTCKAALRLWPQLESHGNQAIMYALGLHLRLDTVLRHPPHRAAPDAYVTAAILRCILLEMHTRQPEATLSEIIDQLVQWTQEPRMLPRCTIGEWRGRPWSEVDAGFLGWMIRKPVEPDLVWCARRELERRRTAAHRGD